MSRKMYIAQFTMDLGNFLREGVKSPIDFCLKM